MIFSKIKVFVLAVLFTTAFLAGGGLSYWIFGCKESVDQAHKAESGLIEDDKKAEVIEREKIVYVDRYIEATGGNRDCLTDDDFRVFNNEPLDPVPAGAGTGEAAAP